MILLRPEEDYTIGFQKSDNKYTYFSFTKYFRLRTWYGRIEKLEQTCTIGLGPDCLVEWNKE